MKLKSYFSGTVEAALELARRELGEDAMLVNARPATPETRHLGAYEIVFGVPPRVPAPVPASPDLEQIARDLAALQRLVGQVPDLPAKPIGAGREPAPLESLFETDATLGKSGVRRAVVMLVGPPGVGKTTTLVKLATRFGLATPR